tara:strand:- start:49 stop:738 length:690 start_codon:yes stop_codon:yes gene_type:complete
MSSKIIVDTIEKKTGDDVTLVGNLDVPTSYKITGTDADSIQAPGLITSAGSGLNTSLNTALNSATLGTGTTFPAGHIIQTTTPTIITGSGAYTSERTRLGSLDIWYHDATKITNSITKQQGTSSFLLVHYNVTRRYIGDSGAHSHVIFIDANTYIANNDDFNRVSGSQSRMISGSAPFLNLAAGSYTFTNALARATDHNMSYQMNARSATDGVADSLCSSWMYIQEIAG